MKRLLIALVLVAGGPLVPGGPLPVAAQAPPSQGRTALDAAIDPAIEALWASFDERAALGHVEFISRFWRLPGNPGYNASIDRIRDRLAGAGFAARTDALPASTPRLFVEEYSNQGPAWEYSVGTVAVPRPGSADDVVISKEQDRLALCINSFSTDPSGVVARLVDVRAGRDEDYTGKDLKGAIVLGDADAGVLWRKAVTAGGAIGVISTALPRYLDVDPPGTTARTPRDAWRILQWSSVPYDEAQKAFAFKASPRAAAQLRRAIAGSPAGTPASLRVTVASTFSSGPVRSLIAEIPGRSAPEERIVIAAHVQEPGANDNASGVATGAEMAIALAAAIRDGRLAPPARTITFLFITEISGSRQWLQSHAAAAKQVKYMFSMDMTGEDVAKTGGSFLIERWPDPGAVWDRDWDPHTEWGRGNVKAADLTGDLINDAHLVICQRVARKTGWVVKTNPYEGGSDHTVFGTAGIPAVLDWHFTDRFYHTNLDTPDKTSPAEMKNVGVAVASTAWLFASADEATAIDVAQVVAAAGTARIAREQADQSARPTAAAAIQAWRKWYGQAVRSVSRLVVGTPSAAFADRVRAIAKPFDSPTAAPSK